MKSSLKTGKDLSKKVYTRLKQETFNSIECLDHNQIQQCTVKLEERLVLKAGPISSVKEQFKKIFLPLLSDVLELRQCIDNVNLKTKNDLFKIADNRSKSTKESLSELEGLRQQIEESKTWHNGILKQIDCAINEAQLNLEKNLGRDQKQKCWVEKLTKFLRAE